MPISLSVTQDTHPPCRRPLDASHQKCQKMNGDVTADSESPLLQNILTKLRPFQREAYEFATKSNRQHRGRLLLADEMGLGKTVTSLAIMCAFLQEWPLLVMCPASLRYTWPAEIEKFLPSLPTSAIYVVSGFDDSDFYSNPHKRNRIKIIVATYSLLQNRSAARVALDQFNFRCIIADESHNLKEKNSQRCKFAMPLLIKAERVCMLSGTPALARPVELWAQLHCLAPKETGTYTAFTKRFCNARRGRFGWDVKGVSNADELHSKLKTFMVRRLKSDVLKDLPPKQRTIISVKISTDHANNCRELLQEMIAARVSIDQLTGEEAETANIEARRLLMQTYQATGKGKAKAVSDYLVDWLSGSGTQKILVFAHHREVLDTLEAVVSKSMKGIGHIRIDGTVPPSERASRVRKFQTNKQVRVALLSVTAAGVGLTLTAASSCLFAELHWTPGVLAQAEDRCHRIGQHNAVNIMYCISREKDLSIDTTLWNMLARKVGTLGRVIDGEKKASMNAKEDTDYDGKSPGVSGEEEIQAFFANSTNDEGAMTSPAKPVKGSIQNFFSAKKSLTKTEHSKVTLRNVTPCESSILRGKKSKVPHTRHGKDDEAKIPALEWSCQACTFINVRTNESDRPLSCKMCGTVVEESVPTRYGPPERIEGTTQSRDLSQPRSRSEIIEIDDDSSDDDERKISNKFKPAYVIDLCNDRTSLHTPRKLQTISESCGEHGTARTQPDHLSFSVSKNSGRVAIHAASTGKALHANFDIEQVLTESSVDLLIEAQTKRSRPRDEVVLSGTIEFNDASISQGEFH